MTHEELVTNRKNSPSSKEPGHQPGNGLRSLKTTPGFALFNFELYARPNKAVMLFGVAALTGCVAFLAYMNVSAENKRNIEVSDTSISKQLSKWD